MNPELIFTEERRQPFITEAYYKVKLERIGISVHYTKSALKNGFMDVEGQRIETHVEDALEALANEHLDRLILNYTAGEPIEDLRKVLDVVVAAWEDVAKHTGVIAVPPKGSCFGFAWRTDYHSFIGMVGLAVLLHRGDLLARIDTLVPGFKESDAVYEELLKPFLKDRKYTETWYHDLPYEDAVNALDALAPKEKSSLMKKAVESWYSAHEGVPFHDSHKDVNDQGDGGYVGYWCFELAALCYLHEIDDRSFKEALVYPKDLVQWARAFKAEEPAPPTSPLSPTALSAQPGQPCPKEGLWFAPHLQMKEVHMKQGEPMPGQAIGITGGVTWYFKG